MKTFMIKNPVCEGKIKFVCDYKGTRNGFKHCVETDDGVKMDTHYINRTWEYYVYQTALHNCISKWIKKKFNLSLNRKRDAAKFKEFYDMMTSELDAQNC